MLDTEIASNFEFLKEHDALFFQLARSAENAFVRDPNTTLIKLRQLAEVIAKQIATYCAIEYDEQTTQADLLYRINKELMVNPAILDLFHYIRIEGNKAAHQYTTSHKIALNALKVAQSVAVWFHQSFIKKGLTLNPSPLFLPKTQRKNYKHYRYK